MTIETLEGIHKLLKLHYSDCEQDCDIVREGIRENKDNPERLKELQELLKTKVLTKNNALRLLHDFESEDFK